MAEFLLMPFGSAGDTLPFIGLGRRLKARSHDVTIVANGHFFPAVEKAGLRFIEMGTEDEYLQHCKNPDIWHPARGFRAVVGHPRVAELIQDQHQLIVERFQRNPKIIVAAGSLALGARIARETHGVKLASVHLSPIVFLSASSPPRMGNFSIPSWWPRAWVRLLYWFTHAAMLDPVMHRIVGRYRREIGLSRQNRYFREWIHSPELVLGLFPDWFARPAPDWPQQTRLTGFPLYDVGEDRPLKEDVLAFLHEGEAPIVFTFGSAMQVGGKLFSAAIDACGRLGRRGLLLTPFADQVPAPLPPFMRRFDYVPLGKLLPHSILLVHHGGIGTTAQALRAGIPQLVTPLAHDQFDNAHRVNTLGTGEILRGRKATGPRLARTIGPMLASQPLYDRAFQVSRLFQQPDGLEEACLLLEDLAKRRRTTKFKS